jgi:hypothetical protein
VAGDSYYSCGGISDRSFAAALDGMARSTEMDVRAAAPNFFGDLGDRCGCEGGMALGLGARCGPDPHLHVVRVVVVMPAEISHLLLGASVRWRGGLLIC